MVDLDTDLVLAAEIYPADRGDSDTLGESIVQAQKNLIPTTARRTSRKR